MVCDDIRLIWDSNLSVNLKSTLTQMCYLGTYHDGTYTLPPDYSSTLPKLLDTGPDHIAVRLTKAIAKGVIQWDESRRTFRILLGAKAKQGIDTTAIRLYGTPVLQ